LKTNDVVLPWKYSAIELSFFIIIGLLIIINRNNLKEYFLDKNFLIIFFLFGILFRSRVIDTFNTLFFEIAIRLLLILFLIILLVFKIKITRYSLINKWNVIGILTGVFLASTVLLIISTVLHLKSFDLNQGIWIFSREMIKGFGDVILEEPIFRGFLLGTLILANWKEKYILLAQTFLFWLSHFTYAFTLPFNFWFISPILSFSLGYLAWKSRSIIPSTLAHAFYNSIVGVYLFLNFPQ
jgi:membrane protease YdiL (CAAX protease family)